MLYPLSRMEVSSAAVLPSRLTLFRLTRHSRSFLGLRLKNGYVCVRNDKWPGKLWTSLGIRLFYKTPERRSVDLVFVNDNEATLAWRLAMNLFLEDRSTIAIMRVDLFASSISRTFRCFLGLERSAPLMN